MITVLFVAHDTELYGAQLSLLSILKNLDRTRFTPIVVAPFPGPFTKMVQDMDIPVSTGDVSRWILSKRVIGFNALLRRPWLLARIPLLCFVFFLSFPWRISRLLRLIRLHRVDVVYTNTVTVIDGALAACLSSKPHVWHLREQIEGNQEIINIIPERWVPKLVLALSTLVAVNSMALKKRVFSGREKEKIRVIYNGIDPERFAITSSHFPLHTSLGLKPDVPVIGICGFIQERKGQVIFLEAAALVKESHPEVHFVIIGGGSTDYVAFIKNLGDKLGLSKQLHFTGWRDDIAEILCELDVLVIASVQEPFGRTVIEGMAAAIPIVSTRCGGPEEIIMEGVTGFLVDVGDFKGMAIKIIELIENESLSRDFGLVGRQRVMNNFAQSAMVRHVEEMLIQVNTIKNKPSNSIAA